jgi:hypothetical protein
MQVDPKILGLIVVAILVIVVVIVVAMAQRRKAALRQRFGGEYERAVQERGSVPPNGKGTRIAGGLCSRALWMIPDSR